MKGQIWRNLLGTALPALLWLGALNLRATVIRPHCAEAPNACTRESLWEMDRPAVGLEAGQADALSFTTQGLSGALALGIPPLWHLGTVLLGAATPLGALAAAGIDLVIMTQTTAWNGLLTESSHLLSQRGRPFVYTDPVRAHDFANYTSFYSGHTSFSAASQTYLVLTLVRRGAPMWVVAGAAAVAYGLMSLTGMYRVLAGRHFPTDVLAGALMGILVAFAVAAAHRAPRWDWQKPIRARRAK